MYTFEKYLKNISVHFVIFLSKLKIDFLGTNKYSAMTAIKLMTSILTVFVHPCKI